MHSFYRGYTILLCYLHIILHHVQAMKIVFLKLFLICMFKDANLAEKLTNLAENLLKSWNQWSSWSSFFLSLYSLCPKMGDTVDGREFPHGLNARSFRLGTNCMSCGGPQWTGSGAAQCDGWRGPDLMLGAGHSLVLPDLLALCVLNVPSSGLDHLHCMWLLSHVPRRRIF